MGLTKNEEEEFNRLRVLRASRTRYFSFDEWARLYELQDKREG